MTTGTATYSVRVRRIQLPETELAPPPQSKIAGIKLERKANEHLQIEFSLNGVSDADEAEEIIRPSLESILNRLAFDFDARVSEPVPIHLWLSLDESGDRAHVVQYFDTLRVVARLEDMTLGEEQREQLTTTLGQPYEPASLYSAYRFASNQDDSVTRFMLLYNVLLQKCGDTQRRVDDCIRRVDSKVSKKWNSYTKRGETLYTALRNEIGHPPKGASLAQAHADISSHVEDFQKLVKRILSYKS